MSIDRELMGRWAHATRYHRWDEADQLWQRLMAQWLTPPAINQTYWNNLLDRRMAVLERKEQRRAISDDQFDNSNRDLYQ